NFKFKASCVETGLSEHIYDLLNQSGFLALSCRQVHSDPHEVDSLLAPSRGLLTRCAQDPVSQLCDQPGFFGHRDEFSWRNQPTIWMIPAHKRFRAHDHSGLPIDLRLVIYVELSALQGSADAVF